MPGTSVRTVSRHASTASRGPSIRAKRTAGGIRASMRVANSARAYVGCVHVARARAAGPCHTDEVNGRSAARGEGGGVRPPAQARFRDAQVFGQQHPVSVQEEDGSVAADRGRFGPAGRDHQRRGRGYLGDGVVAIRDDDPTPGNARPSSSAVRSLPTADIRMALSFTRAAAPLARLPRAPRAFRCRTAPGAPQRAAARSAPGGGPAVCTDERRRVAGPGD